MDFDEVIFNFIYDKVILEVMIIEIHIFDKLIIAIFDHLCGFDKVIFDEVINP
jgi:hypothetical protein